MNTFIKNTRYLTALFLLSAYCFGMEHNTFKINMPNKARHDLALPDVEAQKKWLTPKIKQMLGLQDNQTVPIRFQHKGPSGVDEFQNGLYGDKVLTPIDGQLTSTQLSYAHVKLKAQEILGSEDEIKTSLEALQYYLSQAIFPDLPRLSWGISEDKSKKLEFFERGIPILTQILQDIASGPDTQTVPDGAYIFAIDEHLALRILPGGRGHENNPKEACLTHLLKKILGDAQIHTTHNKLFGAKNVLIAGEITLEGGKIINISNESGHYMPRIWHIYYGIKSYLIRHPDVFHPDFTIRYKGGSMKDWAIQSWEQFNQTKPWTLEIQSEIQKTIDYVSGRGEKWEQEFASEYSTQKDQKVAEAQLNRPRKRGEDAEFDKVALNIMKERIKLAWTYYKDHYGPRLDSAQDKVGELKKIITEITNTSLLKNRMRRGVAAFKKNYKFQTDEIEWFLTKQGGLGISNQTWQERVAYFNKLAHNNQDFIRHNFDLSDLTGAQNDTAFTLYAKQIKDTNQRENCLNTWKYFKSVPKAERTISYDRDVIGTFSNLYYYLNQHKVNSK